jgi:Flp pilus assembly protein CpaB
MKASTLFALTLALLLGLGAAATARYAGLFDKKQPPPAEPPEPAPKVLVAGVPLFENITVTSQMVTVMTLSSAEDIKKYKQNPDRYLPAAPSAAHLRIPNHTIAANSILMKSDFKEATMPESLSSRLAPGYRAVNVSVMKDKAAGGVIQVDEYVDVFLTAKICVDATCKNPVSRTACIAKGCKVVMKRGTLWPMWGNDPEGKPIPFTLEVNPYRAALIEYANGVGQLALIPSQPPAKKGPPFSEPTSREYADEDMRVEKMNSGELTVGAPDLHRIFGMRPVPPPPPPMRITHIEGTRPVAQSEFPRQGGAQGAPQGAPQGMPSGAAGGGVQPAGGMGGGFAPKDDKECKTCGGKKEEPVVR